MAQDALSSRTFRVYTHDDVIGVELGGALKNVMAVATGIVEGVGLGYNSRAALITRGLAEMTRLGVALGARARDVRRSRRTRRSRADVHRVRSAAIARSASRSARGATLDEALAGKETVAEGVATTAQRALALAARRESTCRSSQMVHRILFDGHPARHAIPELMTRELRSEQDA